MGWRKCERGRWERKEGESRGGVGCLLPKVVSQNQTSDVESNLAKPSMSFVDKVSVKETFAVPQLRHYIMILQS